MMRAKNGGDKRGRVPLDRALSKLGLASRSKAHELIAAGRVSVDGRVVASVRVLVSPERQALSIDGVVAARSKRRLIIFHKPRGVVTTRRDPVGRRTVFDVLGAAGDGLQAVGRLDLASTGLLLFTNDTRLAEELTNPRNRVRRTYVVTVRGRVDPAGIRALEAGVHAPSGANRVAGERLQARSVVARKVSNRETHLVVELTEGKNRELRRMFGVIGHEVTRIHRVSFGEFALGALQPGQWQEVDPSS